MPATSGVSLERMFLLVGSVHEQIDLSGDDLTAAMRDAAFVAYDASGVELARVPRSPTSKADGRRRILRAMPANAAFPFLDWPGPLPFAHAGGGLEEPGNTMPAFENAVRLGYRYLETDVHVTSDGVVVAFHDDHLERMTDGSGLVGDHPWSRLKNVRVEGKEPIPLLEDLLGAFPEARINIDPKHDEVVEPLAEVLRRAGAVDRVCIGAFSDRRLARIRELLGPSLCTSMGPKQVARLLAASRGLPGGGGVIAPCAQVPTHQKRLPLVTQRFVDHAHSRGIQVHVWTIDERAEMERLLDLGVDGIMTDRPQVLREVLEARGLWFE